MASVFHIDILSPEKTLYSGDVVSAVVPAEYGYMGILANHAPLVARLTKGKITVKNAAGQASSFDVKGAGFVEVLKNKVSVIISED